jgi:DNA-binding MarR family transcriptional regulator
MIEHITLLTRLQRLLDAFGSTAEPLDPRSREILLHIASSEQQGEQLNMSDIRFNPQFGSPATAVGRVRVLLEKGWISASPHPEDGRVQLLAITPRAERQIVSMAAKIRQLLQEG